MKKQGMIWYNILKFLVPLGVLWNLLLLFSAVCLFANGGVSIGGVSYSAAYCIVSILSALASIVIIIKMTIDLWRKSAHCAKSAIEVIVTCAICRCAITFAACILVPFPSYSDAVFSFAWSLSWLLLFWVPTYFYLRNRVEKPYGAENQEVCPNPASYSSPASPFEIIPNKLRGVTDQKSRDNIIAMTLYGQVNPYSGRAMTTEAEWDSYVQSYYAARDKAQQVQAEPQEEPEPQPVTQEEPEPEVEQQPEPETVADPDPEPDELPERPPFCRKCGKPLRADSDFCEYCGQRVK